jgi:GT2 family glycosyltransferase
MNQENTNHNSLNENRLSVVIPTLGGASLTSTIQQLNSGSLIPSEILVCIPESYADRVIGFSFPNVKIIKTSFAGQVAQRAYGFSLVKYPFVLQVDDDLKVDKSCLQTLVSFMGDRKDLSVAPSLLDDKTGQMSDYMSQPIETSSWMYRFMFWIINGKIGYQPGRISKAGINMGFSRVAKAPYEVDWLPGGCTLHARENLVTYNYYPYTGKAYAEDLFQSAILRNKGIKLFHCPSAIVLLDNSSSKSTGLKSLYKILFSYSRIMMRHAVFTGRSRIRVIFFLIVYHLLLIQRKFKKKYL